MPRADDQPEGAAQAAPRRDAKADRTLRKICGDCEKSGISLVVCRHASLLAGAARLEPPFWLIIARASRMWGVSEPGWMYYEVVLHSEPPQPRRYDSYSVLESVLIAMALFLEPG